jgi:hypothetical protein
VLSDSPLSLPDYTDVHFRRDKETSLAGVQVSSNSTGMVHSEQMLPLGKNPKVTESIVLVGDEEKGYTIRNLTDITLRDVGVFRRLADTSTSAARPVVRIEGTYVAKIDPATSAAVSFTALRMQESDNNDVDLETGRPLGLQYPAVWLPEWSKTQAFALSESSLLDGDKGRIRLTSLARLAVQQLRLLPGDVRLVAWTDEGLPGMGIQPEAPQNRMYTLVLAHLARGPLPSVTPDKNVAEDYVELTDPDTEPMPDSTEPEPAPSPSPQP